MDPFVIPAIATAANAGLNLINKPKRHRYDQELAMWLASIGHNIDMGAAESASQAGQTAATNAAARGVTGGGGAQIVTNAQTPIYAEATQAKAKAATDAELWKLGMKAQDDSDLASWNTDFTGGLGRDLIGMGAGYADNYYQNQALDRQISEEDRVANGIPEEGMLSGRRNNVAPRPITQLPQYAKPKLRAQQARSLYTVPNFSRPNAGGRY